MEELDQNTVKAAAQGDERAFRAFYEYYAPFLWRAAYQTSAGDAVRAAQVVQDTFVRAHQALPRFDFRSALSTWLFRIAYNRSMSMFQRDQAWRRKAAALAEEMRNTPAGADQLEARDLVAKVLETLEPQERFLLTAREVDGIPFEELAVMTGINAGALRTRLTRIKQSIRERVPYETE
jgi:RNA polymerase sigma factor (sigma-70 family)